MTIEKLEEYLQRGDCRAGDDVDVDGGVWIEGAPDAPDPAPNDPVGTRLVLCDIGAGGTWPTDQAQLIQRRFAAAMSMCAGISTDELEGHAKAGRTLNSLVKEMRSLTDRVDNQAQRVEAVRKNGLQPQALPAAREPKRYLELMPKE